VAAANPNTIVVLDTGGPVLMPWLHSIGGLLEAWYPGEQDGSALAALLFGDFDPSGHLTETFPARASQLPIRTEAQWPGVTEQGGSGGPHSTYSEGLLVGYRWYQAKHIRPLFPFGFGLSYTSFAYSGLRVRAEGGRVHVSFTITNTGRRAGADVAQVYIGDPCSAGEPPEQLKGFARVSLRPAKSRRVTVTLAPVSFAHWSSGRAAWTISPGRYLIRVGDSSSQLPLHASQRRRQALLAPGVY
jgi:beta-glucosidase